MKKLLFSFLFSASLFASPKPVCLDYQALMNQFPETFGRNGSWKSGEIEIASTPEEIKRMETLCSQRFLRLGYSKEEATKYSKVGIIAEDHYWIWIRDAVTFPGGIPGTYDRIIWKSALNGPSGVAIFPLLENKKVVLNINFRHATRAWELELPRGGRKTAETPEQAAARELREETGCVARNYVNLGNLAPDSGMICGTVPIFLCYVKEKKERHQDESEAIAFNIELTIDEIREAYSKGYIITKIKGVETKAYCRDPFLSYALLQSLWLKII